MEVRTRIGKNGRLVIPASYRRALGLEPGSEVILILAGQELRLFAAEQAIRLAQERVRRYVPEGRRLSEELLAERREDASRE